MNNKNGRVYRKVLFINPPTDSELGSSRPSLGIGIVAEYLKQYGIEYKVIDMRLGYNMVDVKSLIDSFNPDLVGLSVFSHGYKKTYKFISDVRLLGNDFDIVTGGPHLSVIRNDVLSECEAIDFGIVMEGEETLLELCQGKSPEGILGLIHRQSDKVVFNGDRPFIRDLDANPFPK